MAKQSYVPYSGSNKSYYIGKAGSGNSGTSSSSSSSKKSYYIAPANSSNKTSSSSSLSSAQSQADNLATRLNAVGVDTDTRNPLEKFLNLTPDQNFIFDIFELIDRPGQAIRNALSPEDDTGNVLSNAWQGFTGEQKTSGTDMVNRAFGEVAEDASFLDKAVQGIAGFGTEMLLDPLNWVGIGLVDDVAKGAKAIDAVADTAKAVDKVSDATKLVFGFNKGQDISGYLAKKSLGGVKNVVGDVATKVAPEATEALSQSWKALSKLWEAPLQRLANLGNESVTKIKQSIGITKEGDAEIARLINNMGNDYAKTLKPLMNDSDVTSTMIEYAQREMPSLFKNITDGVLSESQFRDIANQMLLQASSSGTVTRNFNEVFEKLLKNGDVMITAKAGSVDEPMRQMYEFLTKLVDSEGVNVGSQLGEDFRRISLTDQAFQDLKENIERFSKFAEEQNVTLGDVLYEAFGIDMDTEFSAVSETLEEILGELNPNGSQKLLEAITPYSGYYGNITSRMQDILREAGYDVDRLDEYIKNDLTEEGREAIRLNSKTNSLPLSSDVNVQGMNVKGLSKKNFLDRSYYGNPVDTNRTMREIMGYDTPTFVTDPFSLLDKTKTSYLKEAGNQTMRSQVVEVLSKALDDGIDNGVIVPTKSTTVFPDIRKKTASANGMQSAVKQFLTKNNDELAQFTRKYAMTTEVTRDTVQSAVEFAQRLGVVEDIPEVATKAMDRFRLLDSKLLEVTEAKRSALSNMGILNAGTLNDAQIASRFKKLSEREISDYIESQSLNLGMKKYANINELLDKMSFEKAFGTTDTTTIRKQINRIKDKVGNKAVFVDRTVAGMVERAGSMEKETKQLVSLYNKYMNSWKGAKLTSVGFPFRNLFGDSTNLIVAGMPATDVVNGVTKASGQLMEISKLQKLMDDNVLKKGAGAMFEGLSDEQVKLYNTWTDFVKTGMTAQNRTTDEVKDIIVYLTGKDGSEGVNLIKNNPKLKKAVESLSDLSEFFDTSNRFSAYQWANSEKGMKALLQNGYNSADEFVRSALFDYSDISNFENDVMRKIFPFYTFMRKNTEFHLRNITKNTRKYSQIMDLAKNLYESNGIEEGDLPDYVSDNLQIPIGTTSDGKIRYLKINPSFIEAFDILGNMSSGINPLIKAPLEIGSGVQLFTGEEDTRSLPEQLTDLIPYPQIARGAVQDVAQSIDLLGQGNVSGATQQMGNLINPVNWGSGIADATLGSLVGETNPETNQYYYLQDLIEQLTQRRRSYEEYAGTSLPTLEELGLNK